MSHMTLAQGVSARHTIHVSCACVFDLSLTLSSHSSFVSPIFYFILLIFLFIFHVYRFGAKPPVRFREWGVWPFGQQRPSQQDPGAHAQPKQKPTRYRSSLRCHELRSSLLWCPFISATSGRPRTPRWSVFFGASWGTTTSVAVTAKMRLHSSTSTQSLSWASVTAVFKWWNLVRLRRIWLLRKWSFLLHGPNWANAKSWFSKWWTLRRLQQNFRGVRKETCYIFSQEQFQ